MTNSKNRRITIRFSEEQYRELSKQAKDSNMDLAFYIREKIFFDAPQIEQNSFEFKMLKSVSYCVGAIRGMMNLKLALSANDKKIIDEEILKIMTANGLKESQVRIKQG